MTIENKLKMLNRDDNGEDEQAQSTQRYDSFDWVLILTITNFIMSDRAPSVAV